MVDNIEAALQSLVYAISTHLDSYSEFSGVPVGRDPSIMDVAEVTSGARVPRLRGRQSAPPAILVEFRSMYANTLEMGETSGRDAATLAVSVAALDGVQLRALGNVLRRFLDDNTFTVYSFSNTPESIGTMTVSNPVLSDFSQHDANSVIEKNFAVISATIEINV